MARRDVVTTQPAFGRPSADFQSRTGALAARAPRPAFAFDDRDEEANEHRRFPRARLDVRVEAWIGEGEGQRFSAGFDSDNLSVSGAFLASTFFLPIGTELQVRFFLEGAKEPVRARALIVREERSDTRSGFGIRFEEFYGQSEVTLARLFLADQLRAFASEYLRSERAATLEGELERVVDALAAWELLKVTSPSDPWRGGGEGG